MYDKHKLIIYAAHNEVEARETPHKFSDVHEVFRSGHLHILIAMI
jgi:hypothetical protein